MGRKCCHAGCYERCFTDHRKQLQQIEEMIEEARANRQDFMIYLLAMVQLEVLAILDCAEEEAYLQKQSSC